MDDFDPRLYALLHTGNPGDLAFYRRHCAGAATVLERGASAAEICAALRFLLDAPGVTGQLICVDGGQHLGWRTPDVLGVE